MIYDEIVFCKSKLIPTITGIELRKVLRADFWAYVEKTITFQPQKSFF